MQKLWPQIKEALQKASAKTLKEIVAGRDQLTVELNANIDGKNVPVLPVPLIIEQEKTDDAFSKLEIFIGSLYKLEKAAMKSAKNRIYDRLMKSLTSGGRQLVRQCTYESDISLKRRMKRIDSYINPVTGSYSIIEVNQAAPLALSFYQTSQVVLQNTLNILGIDYEPKLIAHHILEWFFDEYSDRYSGKLPDRAALVIEHGYPPKFTDLPNMAKQMELAAKKLYDHSIEFILCFPYEVSLSDSRIMAKGKEVDFIWRNSVYMTEYREKGLAIKEYEEILSRPEDFLILNSTRSWLTRTKEVFSLLWDDSICRAAGITPDEKEVIREIVPKSFNLAADPDPTDEIINDKDNWILKPTDAGFGRGVEFGANHTESSWERTVIEKSVHGYVFQERVPYPQKEILCISPEGELVKNTIEFDFCPHHINGRFTKTALIRANQADNCKNVSKMNLVSGGTLTPVILE